MGVRGVVILPLVGKPGMKVERKLSDFFAEKQKWNRNMETKMEFCRIETETEFLMHKRKQKWNCVFWRNGRGNGISVSDQSGISVL
jgi:hypothetical protein